MIKNMGIFSRNFLKTLGILGTAIIIIHAIVYFTFPVFYAENQRNKINESADILIKYLEEKNSNEIPLLLESYSKNLRISVHLKEEMHKDNSQIIKDLNINKNNESTYIIIEERTLKTKDNKNLSLQFISGTNLIDEAIDIALIYLPYTLVTTLIFSFIFSYIYSKKLAEPLQYISKITKKDKETLIKEFSGVQSILAASVQEVTELKGISKFKALHISKALRRIKNKTALDRE